MREVFRGWRRKVGCVTLVMALAMMGISMRSYEIKDAVSVSIGSRQHALVSSDQCISWFACDSSRDFHSFAWGNSSNEFPITNVHPLWFAIDDPYGWTGLAAASKGYERRWKRTPKAPALPPETYFMVDGLIPGGSWGDAVFLADYLADTRGRPVEIRRTVAVEGSPDVYVRQPFDVENREQIDRVLRSDLRASK